MKSLMESIDKLSDIGKILILVALLLAAIVFFRRVNPDLVEGFQQNEKYVNKTGAEVYDEFYADIYDHLVYNGTKNNYEFKEIVDKTLLDDDSRVLDIGSGTGHHVDMLTRNNIPAIGLDVSDAMVKKASTTYPDSEFKRGDAMNIDEFRNNSFTHILCMYFAVYYMKDKTKFFRNCFDWLRPGGFLVVHMVDPEHFDPILPPGNPLYIVSPQKYAKERITKTKIVFNDFDYSANFIFGKGSDTTIFEEKFTFRNGNVRKQEQQLYMENLDEIVSMAKRTGFIVGEKIDLVKCAYESQYLYIFVKPN
jgi:ubiquinone/menaquinone biosynthesis C-methylase UbiE